MSEDISPSTAGPGEWALQVSRKELVAALRAMGRSAKKLKEAEAIFSIEGGYLTIALAGDSWQIPAEGAWPSDVRIRGEFVERLAKRVPTGEPLTLSVKGNRLSLARFSIPCELGARAVPVSTPVPALIPANAELFDILMIRDRCSNEEIAAAGAAPLIAAAETELAGLSAKVARLLRAYHVPAAEIQGMCNAHVQDGTRQFRACNQTVIRQVAAAWQLLAPFGVGPAEIKELMDNSLRSAWKR